MLLPSLPHLSPPPSTPHTPTQTVTELIEATISHIPDEVLDAPPRPAAEAAAFAHNGQLPAPYALAVDRWVGCGGCVGGGGEGGMVC